MSNTNPIPRKPVKIHLSKGHLAELTGAGLSQQLANVGLSCPLASPEKCEKYIKEVERTLSRSKNQSFGIYLAHPDEINYHSCLMKTFKATTNRPFLGARESISSAWDPSEEALGYSSELMLTLAEANFKKLKEHFDDFNGHEKPSSESSEEGSTVDDIKSFFAKTLSAASDAMISGVDSPDLKAVCTKLLPPQIEVQKDYNVTDSAIIFLVKDYNETTQEASSIGAVYLSWHLVVKDMSDKKKIKHKSTLTLSGRSVVYDNLDVLKKHVQFLGNLIMVSENLLCCIPPATKKVKIYDSRPAPTNESFLHGLPMLADKGCARVLILHSPNLNEVGMIDNTGSDATCSYSIGVSSGFTQGSSLSIGEEIYMEGGCEFVKVGVKISMNMTFTTESTITKSETTTYEVPGKSMAFLYQGYLQYSILSMDITSGELKYLENGKYLSNLIKTSTTPLTTA